MDDPKKLNQVSIMDLVHKANSIRTSHYLKLGLHHASLELHGLTSGLDTALTIMEESLGTFRGLSRESARKICEYFYDEAERYRQESNEIAIWYISWAEAIKELILRDRLS